MLARLGFIAVSLLTLGASLAYAVDGVIEINQAKVLANGGHFPYVINYAGSYRLTSNLDVTSDVTSSTAAADRTALLIQAEDVTIDMNGFSITGPSYCDGTSCAPAGNGSGIFSYSSKITVTNGKIRGMGAYGIRLGEQASIEDIHASHNAAGGLNAGSGRIANCFTTYNGGFEIGMQNGVVDGCHASSQSAGFAAVVVSGAIVKSLIRNSGSGSALSVSAAVVADNVLFAASGLALSGSSATIDRNAMHSGGPSAASLSSSVYSRNSIVNNGSAPVVSGGINAGGNLCNASLCP